MILVACDYTNSCRKSAADAVVFIPDISRIPDDQYGELVKYGRGLMLNTAYYIGPDGINGKYTGNQMNCTNCHQWAGTKPFSFNLIRTLEKYPQYRAREGRVLSLAERVNNCVMRPHSGKPIPLDAKEMIAILCYLRWINNEVPDSIKKIKGERLPDLVFPDVAASPERGQAVYKDHCQRCHAPHGEGVPDLTGITYIYPPLWGDHSYQPGSSMHRVIVLAKWIKANMPHDSATWDKPLLTDKEALDVAAFINDDRIHKRPAPKTYDYPYPEEKAIDYGKGPYADPFSEEQHKFGPYKPIITYWKNKTGGVRL